MNRRDARQLGKVTAQMARNGHVPDFREHLDWRTAEPRWLGDTPLQTFTTTGKPRRPRKVIGASAATVMVAAYAFATAGGATADDAGVMPCSGTEVTAAKGDTLSGILKANGVNIDDPWATFQAGSDNPHISHPDRLLKGTVVCVRQASVQQFSLPVEETVEVDPLAGIVTEKQGWPVDRQQWAMRSFIAAGFTVRGAAYLVGSALQESGKDMENAVHKSEGSYGLMQWRRGRLTHLGDFPYGNFDGQLAWAIAELAPDGPYGKWGDVLRNPDASDADLRKAIKKYEGYGVEGSRTKYAQQLIKEINA